MDSVPSEGGQLAGPNRRRKEFRKRRRARQSLNQANQHTGVGPSGMLTVPTDGSLRTLVMLRRQCRLDLSTDLPAYIDQDVAYIGQPGRPPLYPVMYSFCPIKLHVGVAAIECGPGNITLPLAKSLINGKVCAKELRMQRLGKDQPRFSRSVPTWTTGPG